MILPAGTFRVSDYRKGIPNRVLEELLKRYEVDHRPPLCDRPYDTEANDFIPPQWSVEHLFLIEKAEHRRRTFGRQPGAEKTVTTRGSDVGERARTRRLRRAQAAHERAMSEKHQAAATTRPKRKLPSRPFPKGHRPLRSRKQANNR